MGCPSTAEVNLETCTKTDLKFNIKKTKIKESSPIASWQIEGEKVETVTFYFLGLQNHWRWWLQPWNWKTPGKISYDQPRQCIKMQRHHFANKGPCSQSYAFSSHVQMWELDHKKDWALKKWHFRIVVLEKTLENTLDCKEIKPVHPKGNQPWLFTGRTDVETEVPIRWPPDPKSWLIGKDPDAGKDWRQKVKGAAEDEMVRRHHWLNRQELSKLWKIVKNREAWGAAVHGVANIRTQMSNWTTMNNNKVNG